MIKNKKIEKLYTCLSFGNFTTHLLVNGKTPRGKRANRLFDLYKLAVELNTTTRKEIVEKIPLYAWNRSLLSRDLKILKEKNLVFSNNERVQWIR
jgi:hypothetical protein